MKTAGESGPVSAGLTNPFLQAPHAKKIATVLGIYICVLASISQSSGLSTLLPVAAMEIGGMDIYPLASSFSGPVSIALMPLFGYLAARNPAIKRPLFSASILIGALALLVRGMTDSMAVIVVTALLYGFVSAAVFVLGLTTIRDIFEKQDSGLYLGIFGAMQASGMILGSLLTGICIDVLGWRPVCFVLCALFIIGGLTVLLFSVKVSTADVAHLANKDIAHFDAPGTAALILFLFPLITAISCGKSVLPFGSFWNNALFVFAAIALVALIAIIKKKQASAIIPISVLKNRNVLCLASGNLCLSFANMPVFFFIPMYVLTVMNESALMASVTTVCLGLPGIVLGPIFGRRIAKAGTARNVICIGIVSRLLLLLGLIFFLTPDTNMVVLFAILLVFGGIASSVQQDSFVTGSQIQLPEKIRVQGASIVNVGQNVGSVLGVAAATLAVNALGVTEGLPLMFWISIGFVVAASVPTFLLKKGTTDNASISTK